MLNNRGIGLLELLAVGTIVGILALMSTSLMVTMGKMKVKLDRSTTEALDAYSKLQALSNLDKLDWVTSAENTAGIPLLCFQNGLVFICEEAKPCKYLDNGWQRVNKICSEGVLIRKEIN